MSALGQAQILNERLTWAGLSHSETVRFRDLIDRREPPRFKSRAIWRSSLSIIVAKKRIFAFTL